MSCKIEFDNLQEPFTSGSPVIGRVVCQLTSSENIRGVRIKVLGQEACLIDKEHRFYIFFYEKHILAEEGTLGPGLLDFPFRFDLPSDLPSDYKHASGGIVYKLIAKVDRPHKLDHTDMKIINVFSPLRLSSIQDLKLSPASYSATKDLSCCFCSRGTLNMEIRMEKEAYVRGEMVKLVVEVNNSSSIPVNSVRVDINIKVWAFAWKNAKRVLSLKNVASTTGSGVDPGSQTYFNLSLQIPQDAEIPNFSNCEVYKCTAILQVLWSHKMSCKIEFDNHQQPFTSGSPVLGRVVCQLTSSENTRGVSIKLLGIEMCLIDKVIRVCAFIEEELILAEQGVLGPGLSDFPFRFNLPIGLPSDYRGPPYGGVHYKLMAKVDRPHKLDHTDMKIIKVFSPLRLSSIQDLKLGPGSYRATKDLSCCFCSRGTLNMEIRTEKEAYVRGEMVKLVVDVNNSSSIPVNKLRVNINIKVWTFAWKDAKRALSIKNLASTTDSGVDPGSQKYFNLSLQIPQDAEIPNFSNCEIYKCTGIVQVIAVLPTFHSNLVFDREIAIAHLPV